MGEDLDLDRVLQAGLQQEQADLEAEGAAVQQVDGRPEALVGHDVLSG